MARSSRSLHSSGLLSNRRAAASSWYTTPEKPCSRESCNSRVTRVRSWATSWKRETSLRTRNRWNPQIRRASIPTHDAANQVVW